MENSDRSATSEAAILEAIDQLRQRKARPDLVRISHLVQRKHGMTYEVTESELERLVDKNVVLKVDYKGDISYRNAAKWKKTSFGNVLNGKSTSTRIYEALSALLSEQLPEGQEQTGASVADIEKWIAENYTVSELTSNGAPDTIASRLDTVLDREVEVGRLIKLTNGNYVIGNLPTRNSSSPNDASTHDYNATLAGIIATMKEKRARKKKNRSFDPADFNPLKKAKLHLKSKSVQGLKLKKVKDLIKLEDNDGLEISFPEQKIKAEETGSRPASALSLGPVEPKCDYCIQPAGLNPKGQPEDLLICEDCNAKAHPSCMNYCAELARRALHSPWQCIDCKTCCICTDADDAAEMLFCDGCDKGYHMKCHQPMIVNKPSGKWVCSRCLIDGCQITDEDEYQNQHTTVNTGGTSCLPTPCASPISDYNVNHTKIKPHRNTSATIIPKPEVALEEVMAWNVEDVVMFLTKKGFAQQADFFRDQEIDGKSLLLLKRADVLTGLRLKLGPALKIHREISQLQMDVETS